MIKEIDLITFIPENGRLPFTVCTVLFSHQFLSLLYFCLGLVFYDGVMPGGAIHTHTHSLWPY